ncbi:MULTISPECIES: H-NS histone family protein [unclassified Luteimonas]
MAIDLNELTPKELGSLITRAKRRQVILKKRKPIATVRNRLITQAEAEGYTIEDLFGVVATKKTATRKTTKTTTKGRKVPPKYRNPENPEETWTGRGKQPRWMVREIGTGKQVEDFLIK